MKKKFLLVVGGFLAIAVVGSFAALALSDKQENEPAPVIGGFTPMPDAVAGVSSNVHVENGVQVIEIMARGGYKPEMTTAKANMPSIIRVKTNSTYDCSAALTIPSLNYKTRLPFSGTTEVPIPAQTADTEMLGVCSMGMDSFRVKFIS